MKGNVDMELIYKQAEQMQQRAREIIEDTHVIAAWQSVGATINLVGSLKTGLLVNNHDIDFHIYTQPFKLEDSFRAIAILAENKRIIKIEYVNLLDAEDNCIEWHAWYKDQQEELWHIDMIHILTGSPWAGYFEKVAERISAVLTPETRDAILRIKYTVPAGEKVMGIQVYQAVLQGGARNYDDFQRWMEQQPGDQAIITWMP
mgnify:CR=1 FL=1